MQGESSSAESKVAATSNPGRYKCANCSRLFKSRRARGGHEIAHRKAREMRGKAYGPVLAAVLIHHIPSDDEEEGEPAEAAANQEGTGSSQNTPKVVQTGNKAKGNESVTNKPKSKAAVKSSRPRAAKIGTSQRRPNKKPVRDQKSDHYQQQQQQLQPQRQPQPQSQQLCTKDFLGEWNPICNVTDGAETSNKSSQKNPLNPATRVFWETSDDDLNLELQLCSSNVEKLDLELKLGF